MTIDSSPLVVDTPRQAELCSQPPLLVLQPLQDLLDQHGLGTGPIEAQLIGDGASNATFRILRGDAELVLRRPPRPPYHRGAHDVLRESRVVHALRGSEVPVPRILLTCDDSEVIGAPFYLMEFLDGEIVTYDPPTEHDSPDGRATIAREMIRTLAKVHRVDWEERGLSVIDRGPSQLDRQLRRWGRIWATSRGREIPAVDRAFEALAGAPPSSSTRGLVHGDFRPGNIMLARGPSIRVQALLDWEITVIDDPMLDLGWMLSCHPDRDGDGPLTEMADGLRGPGLPSRTELAELYSTETSRDLPDLTWYVAFAYWRAAVGLETIHRKLLDRSIPPSRFNLALGDGIPALAERALDTLSAKAV